MKLHLRESGPDAGAGESQAAAGEQAGAQGPDVAAGEGPSGLGFLPLVILHGLFGSGDNWSSIARELPELRCLMPDLLNHGSSPHKDDFTLESMADDVIETLDDAGIRRFGVMGHSLGGKIALLVALNAPARVERLAILDVAPKVYEERHRFIINALQKVAAAGCESRKEADKVLEEDIPQRPIRAFLLKNFVPTEEGYRWRINLDALDSGYSKLVSWPDLDASFEGPSLVISGGRSSYVTPEDEALFRRFLSDPEIRVLPEAGHWVHTDDRHGFLAHLRRFLFSS